MLTYESATRLRIIFEYILLRQPVNDLNSFIIHIKSFKGLRISKIQTVSFPNIFINPKIGQITAFKDPKNNIDSLNSFEAQ